MKECPKQIKDEVDNEREYISINATRFALSERNQIMIKEVREE